MADNWCILYIPNDDTQNYPCCRLQLVVETLVDIYFHEPTNQKKSPELINQRIRKRIIKILGTIVINSPISPPWKCFHSNTDFKLFKVIEDTPAARKGRGGGGGGRGRKRDDGEIRTSDDESGREDNPDGGEDRSRKRKREKKPRKEGGKETKKERRARKQAEKRERDKEAGIEKLSSKQKLKIKSRAVVQSDSSSDSDGGRGRMQIADSRYIYNR